MLLVQLSARLSPLGGAEYTDDLSFIGEVLNHRAHIGRAPLSRHRRRQGRSSDLELQPVPPVCAQWLGDHVGLIPAPGNLAVTLLSLTGGTPMSVTVCLKMTFSNLQK